MPARSEFPGTLQPQQASLVRQAVQELENARNLNNDERVKAAEKTLRSLGIDPTASGVKEAGRFLTDDRVKGRSQEQRQVTDDQAEREAAADVTKVPGGGPDDATPGERDEDQAGKLIPAAHEGPDTDKGRAKASDSRKTEFADASTPKVEDKAKAEQDKARSSGSRTSGREGGK